MNYKIEQTLNGVILTEEPVDRNPTCTPMLCKRMVFSHKIDLFEYLREELVDSEDLKKEQAENKKISGHYTIGG